MVNRDVIAVIPARGGSKRIPRKNIVDFCGKPMLAWTVEAALASGVCDRVIVSTDDDEIAAIARACGAEVPFLRDRHADDQTPVSLATLHGLEQAERHWNESYQVVIQLMANCPLRGARDIQEALNHFRLREAFSQVSCVKFGWLNPWWAVELKAGCKPQPLFPDAFGKRSQELPALVCPTGAIWIARVSTLKKVRSFYGDDLILHELAWQNAIDIDDEADFEFAKAIFGQLNSVSTI